MTPNKYPSDTNSIIKTGLSPGDLQLLLHLQEKFRKGELSKEEYFPQFDAYFAKAKSNIANRQQQQNGNGLASSATQNHLQSSSVNPSLRSCLNNSSTSRSNQELCDQTQKKPAQNSMQNPPPTKHISNHVSSPETPFSPTTPTPTSFSNYLAAPQFPPVRATESNSLKEDALPAPLSQQSNWNEDEDYQPSQNENFFLPHESTSVNTRRVAFDNRTLASVPSISEQKLLRSSSTALPGVKSKVQHHFRILYWRELAQKTAQKLQTLHQLMEERKWRVMNNECFLLEEDTQSDTTLDTAASLHNQQKTDASDSSLLTMPPLKPLKELNRQIQYCKKEIRNARLLMKTAQSLRKESEFISSSQEQEIQTNPHYIPMDSFEDIFQSSNQFRDHLQYECHILQRNLFVLASQHISLALRHLFPPQSSDGDHSSIFLQDEDFWLLYIKNILAIFQKSDSQCKLQEYLLDVLTIELKYIKRQKKKHKDHCSETKPKILSVEKMLAILFIEGILFRVVNPPMWQVWKDSKTGLPADDSSNMQHQHFGFLTQNKYVLCIVASIFLYGRPYYEKIHSDTVDCKVKSTAARNLLYKLKEGNFTWTPLYNALGYYQYKHVDNYEQAKKYFKKGKLSPMATFYLAKIQYFNSEENSFDRTEAVALMQKAEKKGSIRAGVFLFENDLCEHLKTLEKIALLKKGVDAGFRKAQRLLADEIDQHNISIGMCFNEPKERNSKQIVFGLYLKAARQNDAAANFNVGSCYSIGEGVKKDKNQSLVYYERSAELGDNYARYELARNYRITNPSAALKWLNAMEELDDDAKRLKARIERSLKRKREKEDGSLTSSTPIKKRRKKNADSMYKGLYNNSSTPKHEADHLTVLKRASDYNVKGFILTSVTFESCEESMELVRKYGDALQTNADSTTEGGESHFSPTSNGKYLFCTIGVHPTHCNEFLKTQEDGSLQEDSEYAQKRLDTLLELAQEGIKDGSVVAIGEIGLDYARTKFCDPKVQKQYFLKQLELGERTGLPFFMHNRDSSEDMYSILKEKSDLISRNGAVIHSFDGTMEEMLQFTELENVYIGINGCSLRTEENLAVVKALPLEKLMLETDAPWCEIRPSSACSKYVKTQIPRINRKDKYTPDCGKMIKGRNEPCSMIQVAEAIAGIKGEDVSTVAKHAYENSCKLFFKKQE